MKEHIIMLSINLSCVNPKKLFALRATIKGHLWYSEGVELFLGVFCSLALKSNSIIFGSLQYLVASFNGVSPFSLLVFTDAPALMREQESKQKR